MSILLDKQCEFSLAIASLIVWAYQSDYEVVFGEAYRSDEQAEINALGAQGRAQLAELIRHQFPQLALKIANNTGNGIRSSLHGIKLAIDLILLRHGQVLTRAEEYGPVGAKWKTLHPLNRWGGDFTSIDAYHFSMEHEGVK